MVSPNLIKKTEDNSVVEINEKTKKLFQVIYSEKNRQEDRDEDTPRINVSTLISRLSFFYEKVRNAIDYDEEHLLRKNAILRILRRQVIIEGVLMETDSLKISEHLLVELIRGSYLANNSLPESKIAEIAVMLDKYIYLKDCVLQSLNHELGSRVEVGKAKDLIKSKNDSINWILVQAACEIEESLGPNPVKQVIVDNLFSILSGEIKLPKDLPYDSDLEIQIYLSISRNFLKFDEEMLSFVLFKYYNSDWAALSKKEKLMADDLENIRKIANNFFALRESISGQLNHPLSKQLDKIIKRYALYSSILAETIEADPAKVYNELQKGEKSFVALIRKVCEQKYKKAKHRLWRAAVRSIIYILLTKSVFVFLIEVPAIQFFKEPINPVSLGINMTFPAILLFIIVFLTKTPKSNNTDKIVNGIKEISFVGSEKKQPIVLRRPAARNWLKNTLFNLIYTAAFFVSVYFIVRVLTIAGFNWVSIIIFLFFLAFVSFFSIMTTKGLKELIVVGRKENIVTFLLDLFYMPIIMAGRWLSGKFSKINVFIFLFDFIIEAPFKVLIQIAEDWTKYVRERRENIE